MTVLSEVAETAKSTKPQDGMGDGKHRQVSDESFVRETVNEVVGTTIRDATYAHEATSEWTNNIVEGLVRKFVGIDRDNKYIGK